MSSSVQPLPPPPSSQDETSAGLRSTLRNIPMLPAPANVDDLLSRLGSDEAPLSSGSLAALICDARAPDLEPLSPDLLGYEKNDLEDFFAPMTLAANTNVAAAALPRRSRSVHKLSHLLWVGPLIGICFLALTAAETSDGVPSGPAAPMTAMPDLIPTATPPRERVESHAPNAIAEAATTLQPAETTSAEIAPPMLGDAGAPAAPILEPTAFLRAGAVPEVEEPHPEEQAVSDLPANGRKDVLNGREDVLGAIENAPLPLGPRPPGRPSRAGSAPFAGLWAVGAKACTPAMQRQGSLLADIDAQRGRAGNTTCSFRRMERRGNTWTIAAVCANGRSTWNSTVRLTLDRERLTWKGRRGTATYVRCQGA